MTMRRLDRKRLFEVEKKGQTVDVSPSAVMKNALISATQHREGQKLTTDMVFDFGASGAGLLTKALGAGDVVGTSAVSHLCTVTDAVFGVVSKIETVTLEAISDGTLTDYDLMFAGDGLLDGDPSSGNDGVLGGNATNETAIQTDMGTLGKHTLTSYNAQELKNRFLYLTAGALTGQKASAVIDCTDAEVGNLADGVDTIRLINSDGSTGVLFVAEDDTAFGGTAQANKFNIGSLATKANLATSLAAAIEANGDFNAIVGPGTEKVTVTHATATATNNHQAGFLLNDDPQASNGIVIGEFTGGIDDGQPMASGKLLIRVTGFVDPVDL